MLYARKRATPLDSTTFVRRKLNPIPVRKRREVNAHPKSIAVIGVDAASVNVKNNQLEAPTYALAEAIKSPNCHPSDVPASSLEIIPAVWMTMREARASRPAIIGDEYRRKDPHHEATVVINVEVFEFVMEEMEEYMLKTRSKRNG